MVSAGYLHSRPLFGRPMRYLTTLLQDMLSLISPGFVVINKSTVLLFSYLMNWNTFLKAELPDQKYMVYIGYGQL